MSGFEWRIPEDIKYTIYTILYCQKMKIRELFRWPGQARSLENRRRPFFLEIPNGPRILL
jgi:hypothetical protein